MEITTLPKRNSKVRNNNVNKMNSTKQVAKEKRNVQRNETETKRSKTKKKTKMQMKTKNKTKSKTKQNATKRIRGCHAIVLSTKCFQ